ncbi:uncharacterized protein PG998_006351 [Apiospora kogelbergensis]|uniref:uncharacterized protein n=1 Tax=Apiospora kogelbergensis TaxID=1337665 RepID=UPI0031308636
MPSYEPVVKVSTPLPKGYVFVPKGNVYITGSCRRQTLAAGDEVFAVINHKRQSIGIRVPRAIHAQVVQDEQASRADRASVVQKRDATLEKQFRDARAMLKGSRRVGRTGRLDIETKATLAVRAHIRHAHTWYDDMLRTKTHTKGKARDAVLAKINEVAVLWGGKTDGGKAKIELKTAAAATQDQNRQEGTSGQSRSSLVKKKSPRQVKKLEVRITRQAGGKAAKAQIGWPLQHHSLDSDDDINDVIETESDDESDEFVWPDSDGDSDSEWSPDD